jgi:hypothetical protein
MSTRSFFTLKLEKEVLEKWKGIFSFFITSPYGIIALFTAALLPFLFILFSYKATLETLEKKDEYLGLLQIRAERLLESQKERDRFMEKYSGADPHYLEHLLRPLTFLRSEIEALEMIYAHPSFHACCNIKERLQYLLGDGNKIYFAEKNHRCKATLQEVELQQVSPVEVGMEDIKNLLSIFEGVAIDFYEPPSFRPQLIIQSFELVRKIAPERETYLLNTNLIKREIISPKKI